MLLDPSSVNFQKKSVGALYFSSFNGSHGYKYVYVANEWAGKDKNMQENRDWVYSSAWHKLSTHLLLYSWLNSHCFIICTSASYMLAVATMSKKDNFHQQELLAWNMSMKKKIYAPSHRILRAVSSTCFTQVPPAAMRAEQLETGPTCSNTIRPCRQSLLHDGVTYKIFPRSYIYNQPMWRD
jgi:hypothetical protein